MADPRTEREPASATEEESSPPPEKAERKASYKSLPDPGMKITAGSWRSG